MGSKYDFKVNDVPPPGWYDTTKGDSMIKSSSTSALIKGPQFKRDSRSSYFERETGPDAGNYNRDG